MNPSLRHLTASLRAAFSIGWTSTVDLRRSLDELDDTLDRRLETHRSLEQSLKNIGRDL